MNSILIGFIVYLLVVLGIGVYACRLNKSQADYLLGGKKLNPWVIAFSERASGESAWLLLGLPGAVIVTGLGEVWAAVGCVSGVIISWLFIAKKLRQETEKYDVLTIPEYLARKFGNEHNSIRLIASLIIIFFFTFYVAAQFSGAGKVLNVTFGIPYFYGVVLGSSVIILYTIMGGFLAVAWTDFFQGILMLGTLVILPIAGIMELDSLSQVTVNLMKSSAAKASWLNGLSGMEALLFVIGGLSWGLGYLGQPHLILRYMALKNDKDAKVASIIAILWAIPAFAGAFLIGVAGAGIFGCSFFSDPEKLMPLLATRLLPASIAGILISGAIAAMMSTADSQILVVTSALGEDIYHNVLKKEQDQQKLVFISRIATLGIGIAAFILAITTKDLVFSMVSYAWGGLGASFGPVIVLSLYWKKLNRYGVIAGLLTGSIGTVLWKNIAALQNLLPERLAAFVLSFFIVILVTKLTESKICREVTPDCAG